MEFRADFYSRDLQRDVMIASGNAWLKKNNREIWADQIEFDFTNDTATATGNVHIKEGKVDMWCTSVRHGLSNDKATFVDLTLVSGSTVLSGKNVEKFDKRHFEIIDGSYTNCRTNITKPFSPNEDCDFAWKVNAKKFDVTIEEYMHAYDAIVYVKDLPGIYTPYLIAPVKTNRQTGILRIRYISSEVLGTGINVPVFVVLGRWHDMTVDPTLYTDKNYHMGVEYRYAYSSTTKGTSHLFFTKRTYSANPADPQHGPPRRDLLLGGIGEWAFQFNNEFNLGKGIYSKQIIRAVSHPSYLYDYPEDMKWDGNLPALRSQIFAVVPGEKRLLTARIEHYQSLITTKDSGIDRGSVSELPRIEYREITQPLYKRLFSWEFESQFTNFFRAEKSYDSVPPSIDPLGQNIDPISGYHDRNYIRMGRRTRLEPRLITNVPMPPGFQLQPVSKAGFLFYHFDNPTSEINHREYFETEVPFSLYMTKRFKTPFMGYQAVSHVFQPRIVYAARWNFQSDPTHPFFSNTTNPRFDILDRLTPFEYMRFELINRFQRKYQGGLQRFFLLQVSEQYNSRVFREDPRFLRHLGPIELLSELSLWRMSAQVQALYQLQTAEGSTFHDYDWSSTLKYSYAGDELGMNNYFRIRENPTVSQEYLSVFFTKALPVFFDVNGRFDYSLKLGELVSYQFGLLFASKPKSCWRIVFNIGSDSRKQGFANFSFDLDFGEPRAMF